MLSPVKAVGWIPLRLSVFNLFAFKSLSVLESGEDSTLLLGCDSNGDTLLNSVALDREQSTLQALSSSIIRPTLSVGSVQWIARDFESVLGFQNGTEGTELLRLDRETKAWEVIDVTGDIPSKRLGPSFFRHPTLPNTAVLYGGDVGQGPTSDMFFIDYLASCWRKMEKFSVDGPQTSGHTVDVVGTRAFFYGGKSFDGTINAEFMFFDFEEGRWGTLASPPENRYEHYSTVLGDLLIIYGGRNSQDEWISTGMVFDIVREQWFRLSDDLAFPVGDSLHAVQITPMKDELVAMSPKGCWRLPEENLVRQIPIKFPQLTAAPHERNVTVKVLPMRSLAQELDQLSQMILSQDNVELQQALQRVQECYLSVIESSKCQRRKRATGSHRRSSSQQVTPSHADPIITSTMDSPSFPAFGERLGHDDLVSPRSTSKSSLKVKRLKKVLSPRGSTKLRRRSTGEPDLGDNPVFFPTPDPPIRVSKTSSSPRKETSITTSDSDSAILSPRSSDEVLIRKVSPRQSLPLTMERTPPAEITEHERNAARQELDMYSKGGVVWKRKVSQKGATTQWRERYLELKGGKVSFYSSVNDNKARGEFSLVTTQVKLLPPAPGSRQNLTHPFCFQLYTLDTTMHVATESKEELEQWMNMIDRVKTHIFRYGLHVTESERGKKNQTITRLAGSIRKRPNEPEKEIPSAFRSYPVRASVNYGKAGREAVLQEILSTEKDYVDDLLTIKEHYITQLEDFGKMPKHHKDQIFGNIEDIIPIHVELLANLEEEAAGDNPHYGQAFSKAASRFTVYSNYCSTQSCSLESLQTIVDENHNFRMCLKNLEEDERTMGLALNNYLIKPMQRLCKYPLLLRELLKATSADDSGYEELRTALNSVENILELVNENKRQVDNLMDLVAVQNLFVDKELSLQAKGRRLVATNEFKKVYLDSSASPIRATIWLFTDMFIIGKLKEKGKYFFKCQIPTSSVIVWDLDPNGTGDSKNAFSIVNTVKSAANDKIVVVASSADEKTEWVEMINSCIGSLL